jgi:polyphosphate kinase
MFPIKDRSLRHRLLGEILHNYLRDSDKTRFLHSDGRYERAYKANTARLGRNGQRFSVQDFFIEVAEGKTKTEPAVVIANQAKISGLHAASA